MNYIRYCISSSYFSLRLCSFELGFHLSRQNNLIEQSVADLVFRSKTNTSYVSELVEDTARAHKLRINSA